MDIATLAIILSGVISLATIFSNVYMTIKAKKLEARYNLQSTIMKIIHENYIHRADLIERRADKKGEYSDIYPFSHEIAYYTRLLAVLLDPKYSKSKYQKAIREAIEAVKITREGQIPD